MLLMTKEMLSHCGHGIINTVEPVLSRESVKSMVRQAYVR